MMPFAMSVSARGSAGVSRGSPTSALYDQPKSRTLAASAGTFADHIKTHGGDTKTGISGDEINLPSSPSTSSAAVKVLGLAQTPDNALGAHAVVRCYVAEAVHIN